MDITPNIEYTLKVNGNELRLIVSALYGGLNEEQKSEALKLQKRIVEQKAKFLRQMSQDAEKYLKNLGEEEKE